MTRILALLAVLVMAGLADETPSGVVGRWRSLETSQGGIGAMYDFHADGVVTFSPGAIVEITWRIDGDQFAFRSTKGDEPEQKHLLKWQGKNRIRIGSGDTALELTRSGAREDPGDPLVGEWTGTKDMGGRKVEVHWFFYPAGQGLFLIPFERQQGRYTIKDSTIRVDLPNTGPVESRFQVNGDVLKMSKAGETAELRFARY